MGRCVFCGWEGNLSREHAWPDWLRGVVPDGHDSGYIESQILRGEEVQTYAQRREKAVNRKVRVVCQDHCNGGWMSDLEKAASPVLTPLVRGFRRRRRLTVADQELIAFWAYKTALMLQFIHPLEVRGAPLSHFEYVYRHRRAPDTSRVWLLPYRGERIRTAHATKPITLVPRPMTKAPPEMPPNAFATVMLIGGLVIHVFGFTELDHFAEPTRDPWRPARRCVWPPRPGGWPWPPDKAIGSLSEFGVFRDAMLGR